MEITKQEILIGKSILQIGEKKIVLNIQKSRAAQILLDLMNDNNLYSIDHTYLEVILSYLGRDKEKIMYSINFLGMVTIKEGHSKMLDFLKEKCYKKLGKISTIEL